GARTSRICTTSPERVSYTPTEHPHGSTRPRSIRLSDGVHPNIENMGPHSADQGKRGATRDEKQGLHHAAATRPVALMGDRCPASESDVHDRGRDGSGECRGTWTGRRGPRRIACPQPSSLRIDCARSTPTRPRVPARRPPTRAAAGGNQEKHVHEYARKRRRPQPSVPVRERQEIQAVL